MSQVEWQSEGHEGVKLAWLAAGAGFFYDKHRAVNDCHAGIELLYLINGKLELTIGSDAYTLDQGDAIYFDSAVRHKYHRVGKQACSAMIVTTG